MISLHQLMPSLDQLITNLDQLMASQWPSWTSYNQPGLVNIQFDQLMTKLAVRPENNWSEVENHWFRLANNQPAKPLLRPNR